MQLVERGIGLPGHAGRQFGTSRRVEQRARTITEGQGRDRTRGPLAPTQFVDKRDRHTELRGNRANRTPTLGAGGQDPFAQILRIRFDDAKEAKLRCTDHETALMRQKILASAKNCRTSNYQHYLFYALDFRFIMSSFLEEFLRNPATVGSMVPSSRELTEKVMAPIDFASARCIVEYGPGTGVFTDILIQRRKAETAIVLVEVNRRFSQMLKERYSGQPNVYVIHGSADKTGEYLKKVGLDNVGGCCKSLAVF